ncbi:cytochrome c oxidase subunit 6A2, mitochondrial-like [Bombyx mandarina]|uniref:Cytochrome c oxidase polypeptide VIa n=2 Tax=Bombyx TaxID=7090 RepID=A0A8R2ANF0_BOMMO|nr:cytochrome c oxidase subunit 6A2, mitochondrial [Bombyx mori]XP_028038677.1 cytochrome c oxidase subunit 6A2, mitochondrial-like [Bombyx mandarina]
MRFNVINKFKRPLIWTVEKARRYSLCGPPRPSKCGCPPKPGSGKVIVPPADCKPGPICYNPCVPRFHHGKDTWKKYRNFTYFVLLPLIAIQSFNALGHEPPPKGPCRDYEYMRVRTKRFPWGDGVKSFYHNEHVNHLPGECEAPPLDCD